MDVPGNVREDTSVTVGGTSPTISVDMMGVGGGVSGIDTGDSNFSASAEDDRCNNSKTVSC